MIHNSIISSFTPCLAKPIIVFPKEKKFRLLTAKQACFLCAPLLSRVPKEKSRIRDSS